MLFGLVQGVARNLPGRDLSPSPIIELSRMLEAKADGSLRGGMAKYIANSIAGGNRWKRGELEAERRPV